METVGDHSNSGSAKRVFDRFPGVGLAGNVHDVSPVFSLFRIQARTCTLLNHHETALSISPSDSSPCIVQEQGVMTTMHH